VNVQHALSSTPPGTARLHNSLRDLEIENERLRSDLEWQAKDQMRVEGDLLAVMTEWREKVVVLQDRLEDMAYRHREEKEELTRQMRGMYSAEVVSKLERDLQTALNLRDSALSEDLDARDAVIKELGAHLRSAHDNNQRMHLELQELQTKYHEETASCRVREAKLQERKGEMEEALRKAQELASSSSETQPLHQSYRELQRELTQAKRELLDRKIEKDRLKRESEWAVSRMTTELQGLQQVLMGFENEIRQGRVSNDELNQQLLRAHGAKMTGLSTNLKLETERVFSLEQQLDVLQLELKRKSAEIVQLQASLTSAHATSSLQALSPDNSEISSPTLQILRHGLAGTNLQNSTPMRFGVSDQQQIQEHERVRTLMASEVAALRSSMATLDRECIELHNALDEQKSKERVMIQSLLSKDSKLTMLQGDVDRLQVQLHSAKECELRAVQEFKESTVKHEEDRMRLLHKLQDLERDREAEIVHRNDTSHFFEARSKIMDTREAEMRMLQADHERGLSEWKSTKLDLVTRIAEANARAGTAQEAIFLLEADLEMKNKLLDQVVQSSGEGTETLNIYVASLHHAGLIAKALDARNKELRKKMCESEQYRIVGILLSPHHITTPYITTHIFFF
jgi:chromosome segregation ATPase